ncbi:MAG: TAXI family TRAP transporter solute-binding subunit [Rhodoblastus sp.]
MTNNDLQSVGVSGNPANDPIIQAARAMFAQADRAAVRNRRQRMVFFVLTLAIALGGAFAARWFVAERTLVFAVGQKGSAEDLFARNLQKATSSGGGVRIDVRNLESPTAAVQKFSQGRADIAIVRSDARAPRRARAVAQLEHSVLLVAVPKASTIKSIAGLKGKKLALVSHDPRDHALVRRVLARFDIDETNSLETRAPEEWVSLFETGGPAAVFFIVRKSGIGNERFWLGKSQKPNFKLLDIEGAKGIADQLQGVVNESIEAGEIVPSPSVPEEETDTIAMDDILVARRRLPGGSGRALADAVFENKGQLAVPGRYATNIQPPDTEKEAAILAHPAAAAYFDDQVKTAFERYNDLIFTILWLGGFVGSGFLWLYSQVTRVTPIPAGTLTDAFQKLATFAAAAPNAAGLAAVEREVDSLLAKTLGGLRDGAVAYDGFDALRLTYDMARRAIAARKQDLSGATA